MFETARGLILTDRTKARKALADEIKRHEREAIDAKLDVIEAEERDRIAGDKAEAVRAAKLVEARKDLAKVRAEQSKAAVAYDAAMTSANSAFESLETLAERVAQLEKDIGEGAGQRPAIIGHARSGALVSAVWHSARPLAKRLGLRVVPGSSKHVRPLAQVYTQPEETTP